MCEGYVDVSGHYKSSDCDQHWTAPVIKYFTGCASPCWSTLTRSRILVRKIGLFGRRRKCDVISSEVLQHGHNLRESSLTRACWYRPSPSKESWLWTNFVCRTCCDGRKRRKRLQNASKSMLFHVLSLQLLCCCAYYRKW